MMKLTRRGFLRRSAAASVGVPVAIAGLAKAPAATAPVVAEIAAAKPISSAVTTGNFPHAIWPGIKNFWDTPVDELGDVAERPGDEKWELFG